MVLISALEHDHDLVHQIKSNQSMWFCTPASNNGPTANNNKSFTVSPLSVRAVDTTVKKIKRTFFLRRLSFVEGYRSTI